MSENSFFHDINLQLIGSGPPISKEQLRSVLNYEFVGRDIFDRFYMQHNGGYFPEPALFYRDVFYAVSSSDFNKMYVEGFYFVPQDEEQRVQHLSSIVRVRKQRAQYSNLVSYSNLVNSFVENHFPFAYDSADNDFWIEIGSGRIRYVAWDSSETVQDACDIAPSFHDFTSNFLSKPRK
jgi:hypothetical protein